MSYTNDQRIEERFTRVVKNALCVEQIIKPEHRFDDFGADSLDRVEMLMQVEAEFKIEIPDDEGSELETVQQGIDYVKRKVRH